MIIINGATKKGENLLNRALHHKGVYLEDVYSSWSAAKGRAWEWCRAKCLEEGGEQFSICAYNTFGFSVSWTTAEGMRLETPKNSYLITWDAREVEEK